MASLALMGFGVSSANAGPTADQLLAQSIYDQFYPCWVGVSDLDEPSRLQVSVQIVVLEDGTFARPPTILRPAQIEDGDADMVLAVERALAAVAGCKPYAIPGHDQFRPPEAGADTRLAFPDGAA